MPLRFVLHNCKLWVGPNFAPRKGRKVRGAKWRSAAQQNLRAVKSNRRKVCFDVQPSIELRRIRSYGTGTETKNKSVIPVSTEGSHWYARRCDDTKNIQNTVG